MIGLLVVGFVANELIRPVDEIPRGTVLRHDGSAGMTTPEIDPREAAGSTLLIGIITWLWVLIPFAYGLYQLVIKIPALFAG